MKKAKQMIGVQMIGVLGLVGIMAFTFPVLAQTGEDTVATTTRVDDYEDDDDTDYGWIGLLGLAGLAGLLRKPERQVVHQTEVKRNNNPTH